MIQNWNRPFGDFHSEKSGRNLGVDQATQAYEHNSRSTPFHNTIYSHIKYTISLLSTI